MMSTPDSTEIAVSACLNAMREVLARAASLARAAAGCAADGNRMGAVVIALEVEPLIAEADGLLTAATVLNRASGR